MKIFGQRVIRRNIFVYTKDINLPSAHTRSIGSKSTRAAKKKATSISRHRRLEGKKKRGVKVGKKTSGIRTKFDEPTYFEKKVFIVLGSPCDRNPFLS